MRNSAIDRPAPEETADISPALVAEATEWRHALHQHPELLYDVPRTAAFVEHKLRQFGCDELLNGIGKSGVVGLIHGRQTGKGKVVALRAELDGLPVNEAAGLEFASTTPGRMHACGHDGHMAMLLGAARRFTAYRDFSGTIAVIFQPAEEGGAGAKAMLEDGLVERTGISEIYGMHNMPGIEAGSLAMCTGPIMAACYQFDIQVLSQGGHAGLPHLTSDAILAASQAVTSIQSIVSRQVNPLDSAVVSITSINGGTAYNVLPEHVSLRGTVRTLSAQTAELIESQLQRTLDGIAKIMNVQIEFTFRYGTPVTRNHAEQMATCQRAAELTVGRDRVDAGIMPKMAAEDFSYFLESLPGCFIFIGNGDSAELHSPRYMFNDNILKTGISYWTNLVHAITSSN